MPPAVQARRSIPTKGVPSANRQLKRITPSIPTAPGARGRLPRVLVALATAGMGQSIPTNPVGRVAAPASTGPRAVETPQKLALDAAVANELARQAEQGYTQGGPDARRMHGEAALGHPIEGREPTTAAAKGQFSREALQAQRSFMDDLPGILKQFGMSMQQFHELRMRLAEKLSDDEIKTIWQIRNLVPPPTKATIMQKVIPKADIERYILKQWNSIPGYITKAVDVTQLSNYRDIYNSLRLDYSGSKFLPGNDTSLGVIRFRTTNYDNIAVPYSSTMGGSLYQAWPFTGNGFTAATNGQAIPEYITPYENPVSIMEGAEMYEIYHDGTEVLRAVFKNGKFVTLGG